MLKANRWRSGVCAMVISVLDVALCFGEAASAKSAEIARVELAKPFKTAVAWRLIATQGPQMPDYGGNPAPGPLLLCFEKVPAGACPSDPSPMPPTGREGASDGWEPHYLKVGKPVYPEGAAASPLLLIVTGSLHAGDGGQIIATQLFRYRRAVDRFERVYAHATGTNNNQEVRFMPSGRLRGDVVSAEPTNDAPYGYWVEVDRFTPDHAYRRVLRYRSATRYQDGNDLAVIDAEMPNIQRRLGLWTPGSPLPLPQGRAKPCPNPHLKTGALWCS